MKGILDIQPDSEYNDSPQRYHIPSKYLPIALRVEGDLVLRRTTTRGSPHPGYIGYSILEKIVPDPVNPSMHYAILKDSRTFSRLVPFKRTSDSYWENDLNKIEQTEHIGPSLRGRSVRLIDEEGFGAIFAFGFQDLNEPANIHRLRLGQDIVDALQEIYELRNAVDQSRRLVEYLRESPLRDANFRHVILNAYEDRCAITGLKIINGQGRVEAEAAHIQAVSEGGPDAPSNGIALSGTCHWLFDRHLISVTDDYELLVSPNIPQRLQRLFPPKGEKVFVPTDRLLQPSSTYLKFHRQTFENKLHA